jgi:F-type H+-transporting ATPase subunit c
MNLFAKLQQRAAEGKPVRVGMIGAGIGVGTIFGNFLAGATRNPSAAGGQFTNLILGAALTEALGILAFVLGLLILFS